MKVILEYFKTSGKYYSGGEYETEKKEMFQIFEEVQNMLDAGTLPGLVAGARYMTYVRVPEHPNDYPKIVFPSRAQRAVAYHLEQESRNAGDDKPRPAGW